METETRTRPKLEPVRITPLQHGSPGSARQIPRSPRRRPSIFESPLRTHSLPSTLPPSTPGLGSFDQRRLSQARRESVQLPPITEQSPPLRGRPYSGYSPPPTLAAQTRHHLLYGGPDSQLSPVSTPASIGRRQSMPTGLSSALPTSIPSAALPSPVRAVRKKNGIGRRKAQELYGWPFLQVCFVRAVDLRKFSQSSASGDDPAPLEAVMDKTGQPMTKYEARVWSRSPEKPDSRPFSRYLSRATLRDTIPDDLPEPLEGPRYSTDHLSPRRASLNTPKERRLDKEHRRLSAPTPSAHSWSEMILLPVRKCLYLRPSIWRVTNPVTPRLSTSTLLLPAYLYIVRMQSCRTRGHCGTTNASSEGVVPNLSLRLH